MLAELSYVSITRVMWLLNCLWTLLVCVTFLELLMVLRSKLVTVLLLLLLVLRISDDILSRRYRHAILSFPCIRLWRVLVVHVIVLVHCLFTIVCGLTATSLFLYRSLVLYRSLILCSY